MATDILDIIRENLRQLISEGGYRSFENFAYENGIDKTTLSRLLSGKREPKVLTLLKIAKSLNITLNDLYLPRGNQVREKTPGYAAKTPKQARKRKVILWLAESDVALLREKLHSAAPLVLDVQVSKSKAKR